MTDRTEYLREYRQKTKGHVKRVNLSFLPSEYRDLERAAKAEGEKPGSYIKTLALQAHRHSVTLPASVEAELAEVSRLIRTVANNVNQMARHSNRIGRVLDENEPLLELANLEKHLRGTLEKLAKESVHLSNKDEDR